MIIKYLISDNDIDNFVLLSLIISLCRMIIPLFTTFANGVKAKVNGEGVHRCWVSGRVLPRVGNLDMINDDHN